MNTNNVIPFHGKLWEERYDKEVVTKAREIIQNEPSIIKSPAAFRERVTEIVTVRKNGKAGWSEEDANRFVDILLTEIDRSKIVFY